MFWHVIEYLLNWLFIDNQPQRNNNAYPTSVPADIGHSNGIDKFDEIHGNEESGLLNYVPKLKGDSDRQGFVAKVFGILAVQMIATTLFVYFMISNKNRIQFVQNNTWLYIICMVATIAIMLPLFCWREVARSVPTNYIMLGVFTIWESYLVATIASFYQPQSVFLAALYATALFTVLTIYAMFTKGDLGCLGPIIAVSCILGLLTFVLYFIFPGETMHLIFCWVGLIATCIYVIFDVYMITEKNGLEYDDYIIAALMLYTDLINLFIYILSIIGEKN